MRKQRLPDVVIVTPAIREKQLSHYLYVSFESRLMVDSINKDFHSVFRCLLARYFQLDFGINTIQDGL